MPILYARESSKLATQLGGDVFVLVWCLLCGLLGRHVRSVVTAAADPMRQTADGLRIVARDFQTAADKAAAVPVLGAQLHQPFDEAVRRLDGVIASAHEQIEAIERVALVLGCLTFLVPVVLMLLAWLPRRIRFVREAVTAQRMLDVRPELDLFALRALATQPIHRLAALGDDPAAAWRSGDRVVINALADLELQRCGVRVPRGLADG